MSNFPQADLITLKVQLTVGKWYAKFTTGRWSSLEDMKNIYREDNKFYMPQVMSYYILDQQWAFNFKISDIFSQGVELFSH